MRSAHAGNIIGHTHKKRKTRSVIFAASSAKKSFTKVETAGAPQGAAHQGTVVLKSASPAGILPSTYLKQFDLTRNVKIPRSEFDAPNNVKCSLPKKKPRIREWSILVNKRGSHREAPLGRHLGSSFTDEDLVSLQNEETRYSRHEDLAEGLSREEFAEWARMEPTDPRYNLATQRMSQGFYKRRADQLNLTTPPPDISEVEKQLMYSLADVSLSQEERGVLMVKLLHSALAKYGPNYGTSVKLEQYMANQGIAPAVRRVDPRKRQPNSIRHEETLEGYLSQIREREDTDMWNAYEDFLMAVIGYTQGHGISNSVSIKRITEDFVKVFHEKAAFTTDLGSAAEETFRVIMNRIEQHLAKLAATSSSPRLTRFQGDLLINQIETWIKRHDPPSTPAKIGVLLKRLQEHPLYTKTAPRATVQRILKLLDDDNQPGPVVPPPAGPPPSSSASSFGSSSASSFGSSTSAKRLPVGPMGASTPPPDIRGPRTRSRGPASPPTTVSAINFAPRSPARRNLLSAIASGSHNLRNTASTPRKTSPRKPPPKEEKPSMSSMIQVAMTRRRGFLQGTTPTQKKKKKDDDNDGWGPKKTTKKKKKKKSNKKG